ncbi:MAG: alkaline phosphatase family protein [Methanobacterium sp.]|jgi:predicted AlkP superfamily pyrophosphatase or phosphodiesterase|nr:alkaline phosphatase family protein [Methanobacterium sp.]
MSSKEGYHRIVMILVDALPYDLVSNENCPFMYELATNNVFCGVEPMFAYRGIESTIFTGCGCNTHKIWTEYCLDQKRMDKSNSGNRFNLKIYLIKMILRTSDFFHFYLFKRFLRYFLYRLFKMNVPFMITPEFVEFFTTSQAKILNSNSLPVQTLFDILRRKKRSITFLAPPLVNKDELINKMAIKEINNDPDFLFIKFGELDYIGHEYGISSKKSLETLKKIDDHIKTIYSTLSVNNKDFSFIVISDHGMCDVNEYYDIIGHLKRLKSKLIKDYIFFVDSTMIRFWFFNPIAKEEIYSSLRNLKIGHFLTKMEKQKFNINKIGKKYGEEIFILNEGITFFPDFFRDFPKPKGMHGYSKESVKPLLIIKSSKNIKKCNKIEFIDVLPTILDLMGLNIPEFCEGKSIKGE